MKKNKSNGWILIFPILTLFPVSRAGADGGYFSSQSVAVSADQRVWKKFFRSRYDQNNRKKLLLLSLRYLHFTTVK
jgi:hypothetical protein